MRLIIELRKRGDTYLSIQLVTWLQMPTQENRRHRTRGKLGQRRSGSLIWFDVNKAAEGIHGRMPSISMSGFPCRGASSAKSNVACVAEMLHRVVPKSFGKACGMQDTAGAFAHMPNLPLDHTVRLRSAGWGGGMRYTEGSSCSR